MEQTSPEQTEVVEAISAADLGLGDTTTFDEPEDVPEQTAEPAEAPVENVQRETLDEAPKSWAKDKHAIWQTMTPEAREYYKTREKQMLDGLEQYKTHNEFGKQLKDVFTPYKAYLDQNGIDEVKAAQYLISAQYRLATGDNATKVEMLKNLAKGVGIDLDQVYGKPQEQNQALDPLLNEIKAIKADLNARKEAEFTQTKQKVAQEVEQFASDPKHPYFDECADHIVKLVNAGYALEEAYETAVQANPVTRQKELNRLQNEWTEQFKAKAREEVEKSRPAVRNNVRNRDTGKAPTEPLGTMDETMRETLAGIRARTH